MSEAQYMLSQEDHDVDELTRDRDYRAGIGLVATLRKTRKVYTCATCHQPIPKGSRAWDVPSLRRRTRWHHACPWPEFT